MKKASVSLIVFSSLVLAFAYYALLNRAEPFLYQFYLMAWWAYIILLDAAFALATGRFCVLNRKLPFLVIASVAFWCVFEIMNLRLANWFYVNVPHQATQRFSGYFFAFGTVLPAIHVTKKHLCRLLPEIRISPVSLPYYGTWGIPLGILCLIISLVFPTYCFGLAWVFLALLIDSFNYRKGRGSFVRYLEDGSLTEVVATALSGLVCGFLWEFWNCWSVTKWIYTVPFFENLKVFEMPVAGYLGFSFFALEAVAFITLLREGSSLIRFRWSTSLIAIIFSLCSFFLVDRYTVFSYTPQTRRLPFLSESTRQALEAKGIKTSHAIDPDLLSRDERQRLDLVHLKGMGLANFESLARNEVDTVEKFSRLDETLASSAIDETNLRRVRVFLKASRGKEGFCSRSCSRGY